MTGSGFLQRPQIGLPERSVSNLFNTIYREYNDSCQIHGETSQNIFDLTRKRLRQGTEPHMQRIASELDESHVSTISPRSTAARKQKIQHSVDVAQALTAENIIGERQYWASYSLDPDNEPIDKSWSFVDDDNSTLTGDDLNIYVIQACGLSELNLTNTVADTFTNIITQIIESLTDEYDLDTIYQLIAEYETYVEEKMPVKLLEKILKKMHLK